ncbi:hypothetical protein PMAC_000566 [Pneumocystis sp. 'macacae']|nr:hypothetical protein PMAC_000566 [Pneumocystis sp. 'macacae']
MKDTQAQAMKHIDESGEGKLVEGKAGKKDATFQVLQEKKSSYPAFVLEYSPSDCKKEHKMNDCNVISDATVSSLVKNFNNDMHILVQQMMKEKASLHSQNIQLWKIIDKQRAMILELQKDLEKAFKEKKKYYNLWNALSAKYTSENPKSVNTMLENGLKKTEDVLISSFKTPEHQKSASAPNEPRSSDIEKSEFVLLFPGDKDFSILNAPEDIFSSNIQSYPFNENKIMPLKPSKKIQHSVSTSDQLYLKQPSDNSFSTQKGYINNIFHDQLNITSSPTIHSGEVSMYRECSIIERTPNDSIQDLNQNKNFKNSSFDNKKLSTKHDQMNWVLNSNTNSITTNNYTGSPLSIYSNSHKVASPALTEDSAISSNISQNYISNIEHEHQNISSKKLDNLNQNLHSKYNIKDHSKNIEIGTSHENIQLKQDNYKTYESNFNSAVSTSLLSKTNLSSHEDYLDKIGEVFDTMTLSQENIEDSLHCSSKPNSFLSPYQISSINLKILNSKLRMGKNKEEVFFSIGVFKDIDKKKELWRIEKSVQKILNFDEKLRRSIPFWKIPDITSLNIQSTTRVDQRKALLDQYLKHILSIPLDESAYSLLNDFLNTDIETQTKPYISYDKQNILNKEYLNEHNTKSSSFLKKEGYLTKRGKNFGGWKSRYFVLDGPVLKYYETYGGPQLGTIKLFQAQIGRQQLQTHSKSLPLESQSDTCDDNSYRHAFLILEPKRNYSSSFIRHVLCAKSDKDCDEWVEALMQYVDVNVPNSFTASNNIEKKERKYFFRKNSILVNTTHHSTSALNINAYQFPDNESKNTLGNTEANPEKQTELNSSEHHSSSPIDDMSKNVSVDFTASPISNNFFDSKMTHKVTGSLSNIKSFDNIGNISEESLKTDKKYKKKGFWGFVNRDRVRLSEPVSQDLRISSSTIDLNSQISSHNFRNIFGVPLSEAVSISQLSLGVDISVPSVVYRCIEYLDNNNAEKEEGIYRLSGSNTIIKSLKDKFNTVGDVDLLNSGKFYDIHAIAGLLKLYLRELPTNILTRDLHSQFLSIIEIQNNSEKIDKIAKLLRHLPEENFCLLRILISHLYRIVAHADLNKMTPHNGIVFSPTLNIPAGIFSLLLIHYNTIFKDQPTLSTTELSLD